MKKIVITGACGRIGSVLRAGLTGYEMLPKGLTIDGVDLRTDRTLASQFKGAAAVIHLAWTGVMGPPARGGRYLDELPDDNRSLENLEISRNVLDAAAGVGVKRVVLASSVHADDFYRWPGPGLMSPDRVPNPTGPYGASKVMLEETGRYRSKRGLEVVCVRLGAVETGNRPNRDDPWECRVWLSHRDCLELFKHCLEAHAVPGGFSVVYAVSDNPGRIHDTVNAFGWHPRDGRGGASGVIRRAGADTAQKALLRQLALEHNQGLADRALVLLQNNRGSDSIYRIDRYQHCLQTATRALRDGADDETVVSALFHDAFSYYTTENHAAVAAELLRPFVSSKNYWTVRMHGEFLLHLRKHLPESACRTREKYRDHPWYERTVKFCDEWDFPSDDPAYDTLPLAEFEPIVRRVFTRRPYSHEDKDT